MCCALGAPSHAARHCWIPRRDRGVPSGQRGPRHTTRRTISHRTAVLAVPPDDANCETCPSRDRSGCCQWRPSTSPHRNTTCQGLLRMTRWPPFSSGFTSSLPLPTHARGVRGQRHSTSLLHGSDVVGHCACQASVLRTPRCGADRGRGVVGRIACPDERIAGR